jgi:hypothetical protein
VLVYLFTYLQNITYWSRIEDFSRAEWVTAARENGKLKSMIVAIMLKMLVLSIFILLQCWHSQLELANMTGLIVGTGSA